MASRQLAYLFDKARQADRIELDATTTDAMELEEGDHITYDEDIAGYGGGVELTIEEIGDDDGPATTLACSLYDAGIFSDDLGTVESRPATSFTDPYSTPPAPENPASILPTRTPYAADPYTPDDGAYDGVLSWDPPSGFPYVDRYRVYEYGGTDIIYETRDTRIGGIGAPLLSNQGNDLGGSALRSWEVAAVSVFDVEGPRVGENYVAGWSASTSNVGVLASGSNVDFALDLDYFEYFPLDSSAGTPLSTRSRRAAQASESSSSTQGRTTSPSRMRARAARRRGGFAHSPARMSCCLRISWQKRSMTVIDG